VVAQDASGGKISHAGNGGNGGSGGDALLLGSTLGGDTTSSNSSDITQKNSQKIVLVPKAIQDVSSYFNAFVTLPYLVTG
jgi:hypothetical protein